MSQSGPKTGGSLGYHRLSVRSPKSRPSEPVSPFREKLDYEQLPLTGETEFRGIEPGEDAYRIETVADAIDCFNAYLDAKENANLILEDLESGDVCVLPYNHRWTAEYRKMLYAKLKAAERGLTEIYGAGPTPATLFTLTAHQTDERGQPRPPGRVLDDLMDGWDKFRYALDRATGAARTEYIKVVEPHKSGYPHLHVAVFGVANPSLQDKVQDLWVEKYGVGGADAHKEAVEVARGRTAQLSNPAQYLMKYLSETAVRADGEKPGIEGFEALSALLLVTGRRQYSTSEGLSQAMQRPGKTVSGRWRFVGVGYGLEPGRYGGKTAGQIVRHLEATAWQPPPGAAVAGFDPPVELQEFNPR